MLGAQQDKPQIKLKGDSNPAREEEVVAVEEEQKTLLRHEDPP